MTIINPVARSYDFNERLEWSHGVADSVEEILLQHIPGCKAVRRATTQDDRHGTDWWAERGSLPALSIDVKAREEDYAPKGYDDIALETWSVIGQKIGWTRDSSKRTDYILWYWQDTRRYLLVPFPILCQIFTENWQVWREIYKTAEQNSGSWRSQCTFVPRKVIMQEVDRWMNGCLSQISKSTILEWDPNTQDIVW